MIEKSSEEDPVRSRHVRFLLGKDIVALQSKQRRQPDSDTRYVAEMLARSLMCCIKTLSGDDEDYICWVIYVPVLTWGPAGHVQKENGASTGNKSEVLPRGYSAYSLG